ncbi:MAG: long-chain fatty acid--CoA ligase [Phaeodactylibacter sp.]|nr:long-chain fatty acid--CoA ligase [Phaeodactylibacter sp.]MCB9292932.1 long-chain fatty acid--CoA ligase [Lewinellaceae bacterium]
MDFRRLFDILPYQQARFPNKVALACKNGIEWKRYSTAACIEETNRVSAGLMALGLKRGDRVAILTQRGSPRWNFLDFGMQQAGIVPVPIHSSCSRKELMFILNDSAAQYCIVANRELLDKVKALQPETPALKGIFTLQSLPDAPGWDDLVALPTAKYLETLQALRAAIHEDDLATIIYTSGTTGEPKGVMLSHKNIVSNIKATITLIPADYTKRAVSFLPLSHIFERMVAYTYMAVGTSVYYLDQQENVMDFIREVKPHYFTAVPRFLEKAYDGILEQASRRSLLLRRLVMWAMAIGESYQARGSFRPLYWLKLQLAGLSVFWYWRRQLGGRVEGIFVGAAALQPRLARLFTAAGIPIREGYGMTETSPVIAFNRFSPGGNRFGTVGIPIPGLELRIDTPEGQEEGEILVKGPNVMMGYYNRPEETAAVYTEDGWLRTGDIGRIVHKRFLQITGRRKDIFKTSGGKYIAPQELEAALRSSPYIEECLALGFQRPFATALVVPNFSLLRNWCEENDIHWTAPQFMVHNHKVELFLAGEIERINQELPPYKRIRNFHLLHEPWSPETGELTPTLKARRDVILEKFSKEVDALYEQSARN